MTRTTPLTIAALVATAIAAGTVAPAVAQDRDMRGPDAPWHVRDHDGDGPHMLFRGHGGPDGFWLRFRDGRGGWMAGRLGAGVINHVCSDRGADRLEHLLLSIEQRTDPAGEQKQLFDEFRTAALVARTDFADACKAGREAARGDDAALPDRLKARLEVEKARVAALDEVLPKFEAFYNSLGDAQKQALEPRKGKRMIGERHHGSMQMDAPAAISPDRT